jgi:hypothetical protein
VRNCTDINSDPIIIILHFFLIQINYFCNGTVELTKLSSVFPYKFQNVTAIIKQRCI